MCSLSLGSCKSSMIKLIKWRKYTLTICWPSASVWRRNNMSPLCMQQASYKYVKKRKKYPRCTFNQDTSMPHVPSCKSAIMVFDPPAASSTALSNPFQDEKFSDSGICPCIMRTSLSAHLLGSLASAQQFTCKLQVVYNSVNVHTWNKLVHLQLKGCSKDILKVFVCGECISSLDTCFDFWFQLPPLCSCDGQQSFFKSQYWTTSSAQVVLVYKDIAPVCGELASSFCQSRLSDCPALWPQWLKISSKLLIDLFLNEDGSPRTSKSMNFARFLGLLSLDDPSTCSSSAVSWSSLSSPPPCPGLETFDLKKNGSRENKHTKRLLVGPQYPRSIQVVWINKEDYKQHTSRLQTDLHPMWRLDFGLWAEAVEAPDPRRKRHYALYPWNNQWKLEELYA